MKTTRVNFEINNEKVSLDVRPYETLLETLRERLALTGAKEACGMGSCGACTVVMNGVPVRSCLVLTPEADGAVISDNRRFAAGWKTASPAAGIHGKRSRAVRFLHIRHDNDRKSAPRPQQKTDEERDNKDDIVEHLPVYGI